MSKQDGIVVEGVIQESLPSGCFRISLRGEGFEGHEIIGRVSGKMRMNNIKIVPGDWVRMEMSPYNLDEGRIVYRMREPMRRSSAS